MSIHIVVTLSEFFAQNFPNVFWYPYWYLGNPYHFLIGPVIPIVLGIIEKLGFIGIYRGYVLLILLSGFVGGTGIYYLLRNWKIEKKKAIVVAIFSIFCPISYGLLFYSNGLHHIAIGFLPFILLLFKQTLEHSRIKNWLLLSFFIAFAILIEVAILLPIIISFTALFLSVQVKNKEESIFKTILAVILGISIATIWYTPQFWWTILVNPSLGGAPLFQLIKNVSQFILQLLPLILAIVVVKLKNYKPQGVYQFALLFFISFLFLSIVRFLSDPDFILDWIGFGLELQLGISILLGGVLGKLFKKPIGRIILLSFFSIAILLNGYIVKEIFQSFSHSAIQPFSEYQHRITSLLQKNVAKNERVFLSGSSVFFTNTISQVRGGMDEASIHPWWRDGAYQIREGKRSDITIDWLKVLGVSYILVNDKKSEEPFRDFKNEEKYGKLRIIKSGKGDTLYKVDGAHIARLADRDILTIPTPRSGADQEVLSRYVEALKAPAQMSSKLNSILIKANVKENEVISLAMTYDSNWEIIKGQGRLKRDSIGNIVIIPNQLGSQIFKLHYQKSDADVLIPIIGSVFLGISIWKFEFIYEIIKRKIPRFHFGLHDEE